MNDELNWKFILGYKEPDIQAGINFIIKEDKKFIREVCKRYLSELKDQQEEWSLKKRKYNAMQPIHKMYCDWKIEQFEDKKKPYQRWLLQVSTRKQKESDGFITQEMIARAKAVPASELLSFGSAGFTSCIWHSEKTGSLKWNKKDNTVHCFGCGKHSDTIGIAMQVWSIGFKEAVKRLNNY
jgi:hypothetical protein